MPRRCKLGCEPSNVPLHVFPDPTKYPDRFQLWVKIVGGNLEFPCDYRKKRICDIHFTDKDRNRFNRLNALAVPSMHLPSWSGAVKQTESSISTLAECKPTQDSTSVKDLLPMSQPQSRRSSVSEDNVNIKNVSKVAREPELFSWQKDSPIVCDETSLNSESTDSIGDSNLNDDICSMENTSKSVAGDKQNGSDKDLHEGYKCDLCKSPIFSSKCRHKMVDFRYACVQCDNFDLCGACEARGKHATHYVLRVPTPKPFGEVRLLIHTLKQILSANQFFLKPNTNYNDDLVNEIKSEAGSDSERDPMSEVPDLTIMSSDSSDHEESEFDCDDNMPSKSSPKPRVPPRVNSDNLVIEARLDNTHNVTATPEKHTLYVANDKYIKSNREIDKTSNSSQQSLRESKVKSNPQVRVKSIGTLRAPDTSRAHTDQAMLIEDQDIEWLDEDFLQENDIAQYDTQTVDSIPLLDNTKNSNKKLNQSLTPTKRRNDTAMTINVPNSSKEQWKIIKQSLESKACVRLERLSEDITLSVIK